ncbi:hypothetical protein [Streptomyces mirabilis]|uniref:hypothetical protein n=1 Tax=Streptomyces mirabilis TaxID=68239 RepID=UPI0021C00AE2|nr:hypothetical protein [Streptomyces mirabilis]MCT9105239.1 hypothetical protein [Streptomyces mirabilis]
MARHGRRRRRRSSHLTINDSLVYSQIDTKVNHKCTTTHKGLFEGEYRIRVCTVVTGGRPVNCSAKHEFTV